MTVKDLVSTHNRVVDTRENIQVKVSLYQGEGDIVKLGNAAQQVLTGSYADRTVKNWFQTSESYCGNISIEICILMGD